MQRVSRKTMKQAVTNVVPNCDSPLPAGKKYVTVILPTKESIYVITEVKWKCQDLMDIICTCLSLNDPELFGLSVFVDEEFHYFDLLSKLSKYAPKGWKSQQARGLDSSGKPSFVIYFRVEFYVEHHLLIKDKFTRHYYYLQLRENVLKHCQACTEERCFLLAAFALQADIGNYLFDKHFGNYFDPYEYFPLWVIKKRGLDYIVQNVPSMHRDNRGMTKSEAKTQFIREASTPEAPHNLHLYRLKKKKTDFSGNIWLGICSRGIEVFQDVGEVSKTSLSTFYWPDIGKLHFDKKKFEIRAVGSPESRKLTYYTGNEERSKHLLHLCKSMHQFHLTIQPKLQEQKKLDVDSTKNYQEAYIYSDSLDLEWEQERGSVDMSLHDFNSLPKKSKVNSDQRISVISNTSSNTTSGIVSDKVYSMDESEDDRDDEIMINSPPNTEIPLTHKQMLNSYLRRSGQLLEETSEANRNQASGIISSLHTKNKPNPCNYPGISHTMTLQPKSSSRATEVDLQSSTLPSISKKSAATKSAVSKVLEVPIVPSTSTDFSQAVAWPHPLIIQHSAPSVVSSSSSSQASDSTIQSQATVVHQLLNPSDEKLSKPIPLHRINKPRAKSIVSGMFDGKKDILPEVDNLQWPYHLESSAIQKARSTPEISKENEITNDETNYFQSFQNSFNPTKVSRIITNVVNSHTNYNINTFSGNPNFTKIGVSSLTRDPKVFLSPSKKETILESSNEWSLTSDNLSFEKPSSLTISKMDSSLKYIITEAQKETKITPRTKLSNQFLVSSRENLALNSDREFDYILPPPVLSNSLNNLSEKQTFDYILPPPLQHKNSETADKEFDYVGVPILKDAHVSSDQNEFILPSSLNSVLKTKTGDNNFQLLSNIDISNSSNSYFEENEFDKIPFIPPPPAYSNDYDEDVFSSVSPTSLSRFDSSGSIKELPLAEIDKNDKSSSRTRAVFRTQSDDSNARVEINQPSRLSNISRAQSMPGKTKPTIKKTNECNQYQTRENLSSDNCDCTCSNSNRGIKNHQALHPDIAELRSLSKNLDLPLISALFNDRSLMPPTSSCCQHRSGTSTIQQSRLSSSLLDVSPPTPRASRPFSWHEELQDNNHTENSLIPNDGTLIYKKTPEPSLDHSIDSSDQDYFPSRLALKSSKLFDLKSNWNSEPIVAPLDLNLPKIKNNYLVYTNYIPNKLTSGGHEPSNGKITPKSFKENLHVGVA